MALLEATAEEVRHAARALQGAHAELAAASSRLAQEEGALAAAQDREAALTAAAEAGGCEGRGPWPPSSLQPRPRRVGDQGTYVGDL